MPALCALTAAPSPGFNSTNTKVDRMVHAPSTRMRNVNAVDHFRRAGTRVVRDE